VAPAGVNGALLRCAYASINGHFPGFSAEDVLLFPVAPSLRFTAK
jgi:hypothetical protein